MGDKVNYSITETYDERKNRIQEEIKEMIRTGELITKGTPEEFREFQERLRIGNENIEKLDFSLDIWDERDDDLTPYLEQLAKETAEFNSRPVKELGTLEDTEFSGGIGDGEMEYNGEKREYRVGDIGGEEDGIYTNE